MPADFRTESSASDQNSTQDAVKKSTISQEEKIKIAHLKRIARFWENLVRLYHFGTSFGFL